MGQVNKTKVCTIMKDILNSNLDITENTQFSEIGINSITYIKIVVSLEEEFQIEFADEDIDYSQYNCVADVIKYIERKLNTGVI